MKLRDLVDLRQVARSPTKFARAKAASVATMSEAQMEIGKSVRLLLFVLPAALGWVPTPSTPRTPDATRSVVGSPAQLAPGQRTAVPAMAADQRRPEAFVGSTFGSTSAMFYRQGTLVLEDGTRMRGVSFG